MNDKPDYHRFFCDRHFYSSAFLIEMENIFSLKCIGSKCLFILKPTESFNIQIFWCNGNDNENKIDSISSEMDEIRRLLRLSGGSRSQCFSGISSSHFIKIEESVEIIGEQDFKHWESLKKFYFHQAII
jgi:hypothetical protein